MYNYNPEVNTDGEDNPAVINEAVIAPLSNPLKSYKLFTNLYDSIKAFKSDLHEYVT